jgi:hypothetical protein
MRRPRHMKKTQQARRCRARGQPLMLGRIVGVKNESGSQATYLVIDGNEVIFRSPHIGAAWAFKRGLGEAQATIAKVVGEPRVRAAARPENAAVTKTVTERRGDSLSPREPR